MSLKFNNFLFFNKGEVGTRRRLLRRYKIKANSYAGKVISRIYNFYFGNAINIKRDFFRYYKKEFKTCEEYLICKFNMPEDLAKRVCNEKRYYVDLSWKGDQVGHEFSHNDKLKEQFWSFVGGIEYED